MEYLALGMKMQRWIRDGPCSSAAKSVEGNTWFLDSVVSSDKGVHAVRGLEAKEQHLPQGGDGMIRKTKAKKGRLLPRAM